MRKLWKISDELRKAMIKAELAQPREYPSPEGGHHIIGIGHKIKDPEMRSGRFKASGQYPQPLSMKQRLKLKDEELSLNGVKILNKIIIYRRFITFHVVFMRCTKTNFNARQENIN